MYALTFSASGELSAMVRATEQSHNNDVAILCLREFQSVRMNVV